MMHRLIVLLVVSSIFRSGSCSDPSTSTEEFPTTIGTTWMYSVYDSTKQSQERVEVSILDSSYLDDGTRVTLWRYRHERSIDTQYVAIRSDSIFMYRSLHTETPVWMFAGPFRVGMSWEGSPPSTMKISRTETISTLAGTFTECYRIEHHPHIGNFYGGTTFWFAPHVGIVRIHRSWMDKMSGDRVNTIWELLSCDIR